ncbi:MAG: hypothetical protein JNL01_13910 [Bdellovibrionales bacterium]|nr:hypothetical protein [Bdellovibrionales bacterium]
MKSLQMKSCCSKFQGYAIEFQDLSADNDRTLRMLSNVLLAAGIQDMFDIQTIREIGYYLEVFLNRKLVQEHVFFGRSIKGCTFSDSDLSAEIQRVYAKVPKSKGGVA